MSNFDLKQFLTCIFLLIDYGIIIHIDTFPNYRTVYSIAFIILNSDIDLFVLFTREPVKCGDVIRLQHLATKRNLHSHLFQSPISRNQEVSAFGENGNGDTGICSIKI